MSFAVMEALLTSVVMENSNAVFIVGFASAMAGYCLLGLTQTYLIGCPG